MAKPLLFADETGIWQQDQGSRRFGIAWQEIYRILGYKVDGVTEVFTAISLDFEFGESFEIYDDWPGFPEVERAMSERLTGIPVDWYSRIQGLGAADPPLEIWCRN